jgi:hypothetical protein
MALYTWADRGYFEAMVVTDLDTGAVVFAAKFTEGSLDDWTVSMRRHYRSRPPGRFSTAWCSRPPLSIRVHLDL